MIRFYKSLFLNNRLFFGIGTIAVLFVVGFFVPLFFSIAKVLVLVITLLTLIDIVLLYSTKRGFLMSRNLPERLSNGDENKVTLNVINSYPFSTMSTVIEEIPFQFQKRDFMFNQRLKSKEEKHISYHLRPTQRGVYNFGKVNVFVSSPLQLATRKYILGEPKELKCYPSFLQLKELKTMATSEAYGTRKVRRIGQSLEFEQIKDYVAGDDIRAINWKATAKRNALMVNQYVEEKSQTVYCIIDKGRQMQMHFKNITLLDHAINATLAVSNAILRKQDKAGVLTFSNNIEDLVVAEQRNSQMNIISETLYNINTKFSESDFSLLYGTVKRKITHRSLLILFTNFDSLDTLNRQLPYLRAMAKSHLVLVVFFKDTELDSATLKPAVDVQQVYDKIIAEKFVFEKKQIVSELKKYGIQTLLTKPENLSSNTINAYINLKSRGLI